MQKKILLSIVELGGYPDFRPLYNAHDYEVVVFNQMRKALRYLKRTIPDVIVAEFNFQSDFRDRSSNLESILAVMQRNTATKIIVFYEKEFKTQYQKLAGRFEIDTAIEFPIQESALHDVLSRLSADN